MALTITKLKMWKDPGYTRNCLEIPPAGSMKLPAPDYTLAADDTLRPHKGSTLTELHLPLSFTQTFGMSYLYIEATDGAGSVSLFGWITSIEQRSTAAEGITIRWDVDWWRSYSGSITWGSAIVTRCNDATYKRPHRTKPRYLTYTASDMYELAPVGYSTDRYYRTVIVTTVVTVGGSTQIKQFFWCLDIQMALANDLGTVKRGLGTGVTYRGLVDEALTAMGYTFEIISMYISPVGPEIDIQSVGGNLTATYSNTAYEFTSTVTLNIDGTPSDITFLTPKAPEGMVDVTKSVTISGTGITPDDTQSLYVIDFNGNKIGEIPYNITIKNVIIRLDVGGSGGYISYSFPNSANSYPAITSKAIAANPAIGCSFTIPLPSVPVTTNYWSSYIISGQRDYDITNARIANDQKAVSGLESAFSGTIGAAVAGASAGPMGAIGGAIGGLTAGLAMTGISYGLGENFNDQMQDARDRLYSNQTNSLQLSGSSSLWLKRVSGSISTYQGPYLVVMHSDTTSTAEYSNDVTLNGYETNIPTSSVSSYIAGGGPLQIINLNIRGNTPPQAKQYIKDKLSAGVYIVENNPSGVAP